jgi:hypothetical protein
MATFELWNAESGNLLGTFSTEGEALVAVHEAVQRNGESYGTILALGRESSRGKSKIVASGRDLVIRASGQAQGAPASDDRQRGRTTRTS